MYRANDGDAESVGKLVKNHGNMCLIETSLLTTTNTGFNIKSVL